MTLNCFDTRRTKSIASYCFFKMIFLNMYSLYINISIIFVPQETYSNLNIYWCHLQSICMGLIQFKIALCALLSTNWAVLIYSLHSTITHPSHMILLREGQNLVSWILIKCIFPTLLLNIIKTNNHTYTLSHTPTHLNTNTLIIRSLRFSRKCDCFKKTLNLWKIDYWFLLTYSPF